MLENVPEFVTWGRLGKDGKPDPEHTGETFRSFVYQLRSLGYAVEWQELKACDYGAPTIRKRFFLIARCDGKPIVFPKPTHGEGLIPYRTAAECIDWNIPCRSIFGREKPLAENTLRRIARGLDKFTIKADKPFVVICDHGGDGFRGSDIDKPLNVVTAKCSDGIVMPHISKYSGGIVGSKITDPLGTVTAVDHNALVAPSLIQYHTEQSQSEVRGQALGTPIMTVDASPRYALTAAYIVKYYSGGDQASAADVPLHTVTTKDRNALIESHLEKYIDDGSFGHWPEVRKLLNAYCGYMLSDDEILLLKIGSDLYFISDIGMRMLTPRELYRAQGFPEDYIIDLDVNGKKYSRSAQVARCGNAVPPPFAEALVRANLPELCGQKYETMEELRQALRLA